MDWGFHPVDKPHHKRIVKQKGDRGEFPPAVRKKIVQDQNGQCQICGRPTTHIHHVWPRGRHGRGVYTNGLLACNYCHNPLIHGGPYLQYFIDQFVKKYGPEFYMDDIDKQNKTKGMF
jgi:hypothetical protein